MLAKAFINPPLLPTDANTHAWRVAEIPAANGHGTASALARIYAALSLGGEIDGVRVLSPETIELARTEQSLGPDAILPLVSRFGLGFQIPPAEEPTGPNSRSLAMRAWEALTAKRTREPDELRLHDEFDAFRCLACRPAPACTASNRLRGSFLTRAGDCLQFSTPIRGGSRWCPTEGPV